MVYQAGVAAQLGSGVLAAAIAFAAALRFVRWLAEFIAGRLDARTDRLEDREAALEGRMSKRLAHVELELEINREAMLRLFNALAEKDPANPALLDVARILRRAIPFDEPREALENLLEELRGVPGTRDRGAAA